MEQKYIPNIHHITRVIIATGFHFVNDILEALLQFMDGDKSGEQKLYNLRIENGNEKIYSS